MAIADSRRHRRRVLAAGEALGIDWARTRFVPVQHHLAHASSAYHLAGFDGPAAILGVDGKGEYATTFFGRGEGGRIERIAELYDPDSLAGVYGALTEYLGFEMLDGEYKVMGMAAYGDAERFDFAPLLGCRRGRVKVDTRQVNTVGLRRYKDGGRGRYFGPRLVAQLGLPRTGDGADEPYIHYAAAMQKAYEDACLALIDHHLGPLLAQTGRLAFAGGGALNVKLNQRILVRCDVRELFVQPAAGDAGTALGAATFAANAAGDAIAPMRHAFLGPAFSTAACRRAAEQRRGLRVEAVCGTCRGASPPSWPTGIPWRGSKAAWSSARGPSAGAASSAAPAFPASPSASMPRSSTASAGVRSAHR